MPAKERNCRQILNFKCEIDVLVVSHAQTPVMQMQIYHPVLIFIKQPFPITQADLILNAGVRIRLVSQILTGIVVARGNVRLLVVVAIAVAVVERSIRAVGQEGLLVVEVLAAAG